MGSSSGTQPRMWLSTGRTRPRPGRTPTPAPTATSKGSPLGRFSNPSPGATCSCSKWNCTALAERLALDQNDVNTQSRISAVVGFAAFAFFERDLARALCAALVGLAPGQMLAENCCRRDADLVRARRQFLQRDALFDALDALDVGDL